jgi:heme/copper-type cytochrome/quinol oxidase subunit 3
MNKSKTVMLFFVGSEAFFFLAMIIAFVFYSRQGGVMNPAVKYLDVPRTAVFSFFLFFSSLTLWLSERKLRQGKRMAHLIWLLITIVCGLIFITGQGTEYSRLFRENITISKNVFSSSFFTLTGFHGLHVIIGLIVLLIVGVLIQGRSAEKIEGDAMTGASIYWHFVDAVWVAVFSVVYIGSIV